MSATNLWTRHSVVEGMPVSGRHGRLPVDRHHPERYLGQPLSLVVDLEYVGAGLRHRESVEAKRHHVAGRAGGIDRVELEPGVDLLAEPDLVAVRVDDRVDDRELGADLLGLTKDADDEGDGADPKG